MTGDWHDRNTAHSGSENRTSCRHAIRGAATGGRDDHAVARIGVHELPVDVDLDFDHANASANDDIIDGTALLSNDAVAEDRRSERRALLDDVVAFQEGSERSFPVA